MNNKLYKLMNWPQIEEIIYSESDDPHALLGPHRSGSQILVQAYFPDAKQVKIKWIGGKTGAVGDAVWGEPLPMQLVDEDGYFAALVSAKELPAYRYIVTGSNGERTECGDPYRYAPQITREDTEKFKNGIHYTVYEKLGAHPTKIDGEEGTLFAVWAPSALRVSVVGDFNHWDGRVHQMRRLWDSGIFELFIPGVKAGDHYKYEIKRKGGATCLKADPYGNAAQLRPDTASVVADLRGFAWEDASFIKNRERFQTGSVPVSVCELYLGTFGSADGGDFANYRELAPKIIEYVKQMGYTHVELMPVMEHPLDETMGYQTLGYYAPTARYGAPEDFMYLVNELHKAGIGVILDWTPAHFPKDEHGLAGFDGTCLYEHRDPRQGIHPYLGTLLYNYGRPEVSNYLIANALFWVEKYHADGIRMDAVESMLYLDYGKNDGEWVANMYGGRENLEAIELIKHLNSILKKRDPGVLSIAEEGMAFPQVTGGLDEDGLGFDLKWNTGFLHDYLGYIQYDPYFRSHHHGELTFSMIYAYSEKFMLAFSHDAFSHGYASLLEKMPGNDEQKSAALRLTLAYGMTHPGKKLLFEGQEPEQEGAAELIKDLNHLYRTLPALYELDGQPEGFEWINNISANECYLTYLRRAEDPEETLLIAANFSGIEQTITTGAPYEGKYKEIFNTDAKKYGGSGIINGRVKAAADTEWDDRRQSVTIKLAPQSLSILKFIPYTEEELRDVIEARIRKLTPVKKSCAKSGAKKGSKAE